MLIGNIESSDILPFTSMADIVLTYICITNLTRGILYEK
jgi:hypothetical protein